MRKTSFVLAALLGAGFAGLTSTTSAAEGVGYKDTPMLPGQPWHVHDSDRPVPHLVTPGQTFSHGAPPPSDAIVLFDGTDLSKWKSDKGPAGWKVVTDEPTEGTKPERESLPARGAELLIHRVKTSAPKRATTSGGYMEVVKEAGSIFTKDEFGDFQLHLEFATPAKVEGNSQGRGNSGVYIYGRYEVQVLDSYNNPTYPDGQVGAIYGQYPPLATAPKKPGEWQSYDIVFESPRWDENKKLVKPASVTVFLNGVVMHNKKELIGSTTHREVGTYKPHPPHGPILLQDHGNPTRFRNIWIRNLGEYDKP